MGVWVFSTPLNSSELKRSSFIPDQRRETRLVVYLQLSGANICCVWVWEEEWKIWSVSGVQKQPAPCIRGPYTARLLLECEEDGKERTFPSSGSETLRGRSTITDITWKDTIVYLRIHHSILYIVYYTLPLYYKLINCSSKLYKLGYKSKLSYAS